jgi:hypothetical protein
LAKSAFIVIDSKEGLKLGAERGCKREEEVEDEDDDEADGVDVVIEVLGIRGMGSYSPSFSIGRASRRLRPLMAT